MDVTSGKIEEYIFDVYLQSGQFRRLQPISVDFKGRNAYVLLYIDSSDPRPDWPTQQNEDNYDWDNNEARFVAPEPYDRGKNMILFSPSSMNLIFRPEMPKIFDGPNQDLFQ